LKATLDPTSFNIRTLAKRLKGKDPWKEFSQSRQSLKNAFRSVKSL
jgi:DNA primase